MKNSSKQSVGKYVIPIVETLDIFDIVINKITLCTTLFGFQNRLKVY